MAQALNRVTDEEPSVTCTDNKDIFDETSVYEDSYTLEHNQMIQNIWSLLEKILNFGNQLQRVKSQNQI